VKKKPANTFAFLDTNILFRVITQGQGGCELEHLKELERYVEDFMISLLVPEVVLLELEKQYRGFENAVSVNVAKFEKHLSNQPDKERVWNELGDIVPHMVEKLNEWKSEKIENVKARHNEVQTLIGSKRALKPALDSEILLRAKRRIWAGRVPDSGCRSEADCCILESLARFFEGQGLTGQLLFCTENLKDFCLPLDGDKLAIHPLMRDGLPPTEVFKDLASLVGFVREHKVVEEPAPEELSEALEREKERNSQEQAERASLDEFLRRRAATGALSAFGPDLAALRAMQAPRPDASLLQEMRAAREVDMSLFQEAQAAREMAMLDTSLLKEMRAAREVDMSLFQEAQAAREVAKLDGSLLQEMRAAREVDMSLFREAQAAREVAMLDTSLLKEMRAAREADMSLFREARAAREAAMPEIHRILAGREAAIPDVPTSHRAGQQIAEPKNQPEPSAPEARDAVGGVLDVAAPSDPRPPTPPPPP
jgi:hypothetical protein